jgi:hypothetical protein
MSTNVVYVNGSQYVASNHAKERVAERLNINVNHQNIEEVVIELLKSSSENKMIFNNTAYISRLYEKYGTDKKFKFLESKECIFVCREKSPNFFIVVTCIIKETSTKKHFLKKLRY